MVLYSINSHELFEVAAIDFTAGIAATCHVLALSLRSLVCSEQFHTPINSSYQILFCFQGSLINGLPEVTPKEEVKRGQVRRSQGLGDGPSPRPRPIQRSQNAASVRFLTACVIWAVGHHRAAGTCRLPTFSAPVPPPTSVWRRFQPHVPYLTLLPFEPPITTRSS
jgi:hypothetical protein